MKPHGSKDTAHSSQQTQSGSEEGHVAQGASAAEGDSLQRKEEMVAIIASLEADLASGHWIDKRYADLDLKLMPDFVEQANKKYPSMNLKFSMKPENFAQLVKETIEAGVHSSQFILGINDKSPHFGVVDLRKINNKTSLIFFSPSTLNDTVSAVLAVRAQISVHKANLPDCHYSTVDMNIQHTPGDSGILSLALAKKLHTDAHCVAKMHDDNVQGLLATPENPLSPERVDKYLSPRFYKHTQLESRLEKYIRANPGAENAEVNKKKESLPERFGKNLVAAEGKAVSTSPQRKRITECKSLSL
ncbi:YopJ/AvrA family T3SS effector serine/threonine acetyltransferase [Bartonella phoceensis]|uniref:YopJ/AvrA family T3SS effector serine/threonine acetyltransferase n=1 Tax=Bartonella phoceensis TaxID=270249 RepID=UPI001ABAFEC0|nr:YopJ/AvrA family T3SS effector serine/threonine acetyltransferase [Bartonella phoceensis]